MPDLDTYLLFLAAGRARAWLSRPRVRLLERLSGGFLIGGGLWLAPERR